MDPASIVGITSATVSITTRLLPTVLGIEELWEGVKNIDDSNAGFIEELEAFHFSISVIHAELRKADSDIETSDWWSGSRLTDLLTNAMKTMTRVEVILQDIARKRSFLPNIRSYYRSAMYDKELGHLLLRLKTYTSSLTLPTSIIALRTPQAVSDPTTETQLNSRATSALSFAGSVSATDEAISKVLKDIPTLCVELDRRQNMEQPSNSVMESEELVEIAGSVVAAMTTVSSAGPIPQRRSNHLSELPTKEDWESVSVSGIPLSSQSTRRIQAWYDTVRSSGYHSSAPGSNRTVPFSSDAFNMETQLIKHRFELAQRLCTSGRYSDGIPYLRKTLGSFPEVSETGEDLQDMRHDTQLLLAKALMEVRPISPDTETLLTELGDIASYPYHDEALHLLVSAQKELYPSDLERAKKSCMRAIQTKTQLYGQRHEQTQDSVHSMIQLCEVTEDTDTAVWQRLLVWPRQAKINVSEHNRRVNLLDEKVKDLAFGLQEARQRETELESNWQAELIQLKEAHGAERQSYKRRITSIQAQKTELEIDLKKAHAEVEASSRALENTDPSYRRVDFLDAQIRDLTSKLHRAEQRETELESNWQAELIQLKEAHGAERQSYKRRITSIQAQKTELEKDLRKARAEAEARSRALEEIDHSYRQEVAQLQAHIQDQKRTISLYAMQEKSTYASEEQPSGLPKSVQKAKSRMRLFFEGTEKRQTDGRQPEQINGTPPPMKVVPGPQHFRDAMSQIREIITTTLSSDSKERYGLPSETIDDVTSLDLFVVFYREFQRKVWGKSDLAFEPETRQIRYTWPASPNIVPW